MKARQVLIFVVGVFAMMGMLWLAVPADGVPVGPVTVRFASYQRTLQEAAEQKVDVDSVLTGVANRFRMQDDTLQFYRRFFYENPDRIYLPGNDYRFFDGVFKEMETAERQNRTVRVVHYGDSQIELDRISQDLREALQGRFGGQGTGLFPALSNVPSASISKSANGAFTQYTMYGDSTTVRAGHNRYGMLAQVVQLTGGGTISLRGSKNKNAREGVKTFSSVSLLYGRASQGFDVKVVSDTLKPAPVKTVGEGGATLLTWTFPRPVEKATLRISGSAEIYAVMLDGEAGVAVDNVALRGCAGNLFTRLNESVMRQSFDLIDTRLIILQFGGNRMPGIAGSKSISSYMTELESQIDYMKKVAPKCTFLFIGPADMGKSYNGKMGTWKGLPELNDSLRAMTLRNDVAYWDMFHVMGGEGSMAQWVKHKPPMAGPDYIHFTFRGAQEIGASLAKSFTTYYDFYQLRQRIPNQDVIDFVNGDERQNVQKMPYTRMIPSYKPFYDN